MLGLNLIMDTMQLCIDCESQCDMQPQACMGCSPILQCLAWLNLFPSKIVKRVPVSAFGPIMVGVHVDIAAYR